MGQMKDLTLPEFAFVEGSWHEKPNVLKRRNVILHVRSASVLEVFERDKVLLLENALTYSFGYVNKYGIKEKMVIALHYSATLDKDADRQALIEKVLKPAAMWYCDYCTWEDGRKMNSDNVKKPVYELFAKDGYTMIRRNKPPRFTAKVIFGQNNNLEDIEWTDEASELHRTQALRKAIEFLRKRAGR